MESKSNSTLISSVLQVAGMMELAAKTAPKTKGEDFVQTMIVTGQTLADLAKAMVQFGETSKKSNFDRDGAGVASSHALFLIGLKNASTVGLNCGACGFRNCSELDAAEKIDSEYRGPICAYRHLDLGIAIGSAVKTAQIFNVDNRVMYRAGVVARASKLVDWDYVMGIPLSANGKNLFFDRK
jgi:uncharacterized ferredoxin-like protein